jgi:hypothetical protein
MSITFTGQIEEDMNLMAELISNMTPAQQQRARKTGDKIMQVIEQIRRDDPKDPAVGVGTVWALLFIAKHMTQDNRSVILLA